MFPGMGGAIGDSYLILENLWTLQIQGLRKNPQEENKQIMLGFYLQFY